jgi:regulation of enolase protein 1 (concanavalin A-like superfamily)
MLKYLVNKGITEIKRSRYIFVFLCLTAFSVVSSAKENEHGNPPVSSRQVEVENTIFTDFKTYTIGKNTLKGTTTVKDSITEVVASGTDIWGTEDEGYFIFRQLKGDFEISVRVHSLSASHLYSKAGIMARQDLSDNSKHVYFLVFPDNEERNNNNGGSEFQYRPKRGGESKAIYPNRQTAGEKFNVNYPDTWIKLQREKNTFSAFLSNDSLNWNLYTSYEQKMPKSLLVGLAVTSHNANGYTKAEFSELEVTGIK